MSQTYTDPFYEQPTPIVTTEKFNNRFHIEYYGNDTSFPSEKWKEGNYKDGKLIY